MAAYDRHQDLSAADRQLLAQIRDSFAQAVRSNQPASIEQYLSEAPAQIQDGLLADLLRIELEQQLSLGESLDTADLDARFPDQCPIVSQVVEAVYRDFETIVGRAQQESKAGSLDDTRTLDPNHDASPSRAGDREAVGSFIGPYRLIRKIGEGGMGSVYLAHQTAPVERHVALKIIKLGMDSKQVIARFEAERQALAMMDHNSIARVYEAGTSTSGQPYFVMELVKGAPITKYIQTNDLALTEKLALFVDVCRAVQHAHQKGIIHRDIKPSNILVAEADGQHVAKVIDFGIAKATSGQVSEQTLLTELGQVIGTLEYMSPEQAGLNPLDVDTRSDVYSLGVVLYQLLTGTTPIMRQQLSHLDLTGMLRAIREMEPAKPSTRISHASDAESGMTSSSGWEQVSRQIRGDLDWVVMKALEKDRSRRYQSASDFADDVERFLRDETVQARPASFGYRLRKLIRRNKTVVATTFIVTAALLLGGIVSAWQAVRATRALAAERQANVVATKRLEQLGNANTILASIFRDLDPHEEDVGGQTLSAQLAERLDQAAQLFDGESVGDPLTVSDLQFTLGRTQRGLGEGQKALALLQQVVALRETTLGPAHPKTLEAMAELGHAHQGLGNVAEAVELFSHVSQQRQEILGAEHRDTLISLSELASAHSTNGQLMLGLELQQAAYEAMERELGADDVETIKCLNRLAYHTFDINDSDHDALAEQLYQLTIQRMSEHYGENHFKTLMATGSLAAVYTARGKHQEAIEHYERLLEQFRQTIGADHIMTIQTGCSLAYAYDKAGQSERGLQLLAENVDKLKQKLGADHPRSLGYMNLLAYTYEQNDQLDAAIQLHDETYRLREGKLGSTHPDTLTSLSNLGWCYRRIGKHEDSIRCYRLALPNVRAQFGPDHEQTMGCLRNFAWALLEGQQFVEAEQRLSECLPFWEAKAPDHWRTYRDQARLGATLAGQQRYDEAEPLLLAAYEAMKNYEDRMPADAIAESIQYLVELYEARDAVGDAERAATWKALQDQDAT